MGAAAALVFCEEPEVIDSPQIIDAVVEGDLSQPQETREPLLVSETTVPAVPIASEPVLFSFDSPTLQFELDCAELLPGASRTLAPAVDYLRKFPEVKVRVAGHTCWLGTEAYNQTLSEKRAQAVTDFIASQGIEVGRLVVEAYGETRPVADNRTDAGRQQNRRVEVIQI